MKVLHVMAGAEHGGAETYFVDLVSALARAGLDQRAVIRRHAARAAKLRAAGVKTVELAFGGRLDLATRPRLAREIADFRPDIVQSWMNRATRFVSRPGRWRRFVHVGWFGGYYKVANYRSCDHLVGVTPAIRAHQVAHGWPEDKAHYIPTFAETRRVPPVPRTSLDTPEDAPVILALGRLHRKKAFDVLIRALASVPDAHLWIAGEGELRAALQSEARRAGVADRVHLLGWRDDREALFAAADLCVVPSRYEPFGTVMIEAWAQDVPLVAAASTGPAGLVRDGVDGLLVPVDDAVALAAAINRVLNEPGLRERLIEGARRAFAAAYTEEAVVRRYRDLYTCLARGGPA